MKVICSVFRSPKQEGMYLYVDKKEALSRVPEALLKQFGKPQQAMTLLLHPERTLALVDVANVLAELEQKGYYLQMPPQPEAYMRKLHQQNHKI
ncbi:MAG: YcgL domain-containing protein [Spongiibacteraceae bacterium]